MKQIFNGALENFPERAPTAGDAKSYVRETRLGNQDYMAAQQTRDAQNRINAAEVDTGRGFATKIDLVAAHFSTFFTVLCLTVATVLEGRMEAERRQVTVLFTDMVGFTTFSERSGEEAAFTLMRSLAKLMDEAVREQGGVVQSHRLEGAPELAQS